MGLARKKQEGRTVQLESAPVWWWWGGGRLEGASPDLGAPICALKGCLGPRPYCCLQLCCDPLQTATIVGNGGLAGSAWSGDFHGEGGPALPPGAPQALCRGCSGLEGRSRVQGVFLSQTPKCLGIFRCSSELEWERRSGRGERALGLRKEAMLN